MEVKIVTVVKEQSYDEHNFIFFEILIDNKHMFISCEENIDVIKCNDNSYVLTKTTLLTDLHLAKTLDICEFKTETYVDLKYRHLNKDTIIKKLLTNKFNINADAEMIDSISWQIDKLIKTMKGGTSDG